MSKNTYNYINMTKTTTNKTTRRTKIIALISFVAIFLALLVFLFYGDNFDILKEIFDTNATKDEIRESIGELGIRAYIVVFVLAMIQVVFTFIPAEPLHVVAGISFGLLRGVAVCFAGILAGNTIIFFLNKFFGLRVKDLFASDVDIDFEKAKKSKRVALIVILLYVLPAIPYGIICFFASSMGMGYLRYIMITGVGSIPSLILDVGLGHITMATSWTVSIIVFVAIIILLALMFIYKKQIFGKVNEYIVKSHEKTKNKVGNYNPLVFKGAGNLIYYSLKGKAKIKLTNNVGELEKPCIVLCNHGSFYDFIWTGKMLMKYKPHYVVARMYFGHKILRYILDRTGALPKSMFTNDVESAKNCVKVINNGEMLVMMPEARLSTVGLFEDIQDTTIKFIHKMAVNIYTIQANGSYLAKPKWADKFRKGSVIEVELNKLYSAEEVKNLSFEEVKLGIEKAIGYNEWEWLENNKDISYKSKTIAHGLENVLCVCPKCHKKHSLKTDKNIITCESCDLKVEVDNRYQLSGVEFKNIAEWHNWQTEVFRQEIKENEDFKLESEVELRHLSKDGKSCTRHAGNGKCVFDKTGLKYTGTQDGVEIEKFFPVEHIYRVLFGAGEDFEIYDGKELYYFAPTDLRSCVEWYIVSGILKENN